MSPKRKSMEIDEQSPGKEIRFDQDLDSKLDSWVSAFYRFSDDEKHWIAGLKCSLIPAPTQDNHLYFNKKKLIKFIIDIAHEDGFMQTRSSKHGYLLVMLLNARNEDIQTLGCLLIIKQAKSISEEFLRMSIPSLIQLLNSELPFQGTTHKEVAALAIRMLSKRGEDLRLRLGRSGVFLVLLRLVSRFEGKLQVLSLKAIRELVLSTKANQDIFAQLGGIQILINELSSASEEVKCYILEVLGMLASLRDVRLEIGSHTGIQALIEVLRLGSMAAKARAAHALGFLAFTKRLRRRIVDAGGIPVLVDLLRDGDDTAKLMAGNSLGIISACLDHLRQVAQAGAIPLFIDLLQGGNPHGKDIAEDTFCILAVSEENALAIVNHLVLILQNGSLEAKAAAADVLWDLASYRHSTSVLMESGAIPILVELLRNENDELRENVSGAIAQLTYNDDDRDMLAESGVIPILVELLQDRSPDVKGNATEAVHNFVQDAAYRSTILGACEPLGLAGILWN